MKVITILSLFIVVLFAFKVYAQEEIDVVYLKNGSIIKGKIIETVPNESIKIKTRDGSIFVYKMEEIQKYTKETVKGEDAEEQEPISQKKTSVTKGFIVWLGGGVDIPTGTLDDGWNLGFNFHGSGGYLFNKNLGERTELQYNTFSFDDRGLAGFSGGTFHIFSIKEDFLAGNFDINSTVLPYGVVGLGLYVNGASDLTYTDPILGTIILQGNSESDFGIGVGGGLGIRVGRKVAIFGEVQFNNIFLSGDDASYIPIKAGIVITP